jgi:hypothetical protein
MQNTRFAHHRLDAFHVSRDALVLGDALVKKLPRGYAPLGDQMRRALLGAGAVLVLLDRLSAMLTRLGGFGRCAPRAPRAAKACGARARLRARSRPRRAARGPGNAVRGPSSTPTRRLRDRRWRSGSQRGAASIAQRTARALLRVSSASLLGTLASTMPAPAVTSKRSPRQTAVRMAIAKSRSPVLAT